MTTAVVRTHGAMTGSKPAYAVDSIDNALMALDLLVGRPQIRLSELASELRIGRATAHRLLQMLVFRGFAVQNLDRSYAGGPALFAEHQTSHFDEMQYVRTAMRPHLQLASDALGETTHLTVLFGNEAVCLDSVEGTLPLHTPSARGSRYPAEFVSAGLLLLASLRAEDLRRRFACRPEESLASLQRLVASTRRRGFGLVIDEGRAGITSVASLVRDQHGQVIAAMSSSAPTMRMSRAQTIAAAEVLRATSDAARGALRPRASSLAHFRTCKN